MDDAALFKRIIIVAAAGREVPLTAVVMHESVFFHEKCEGEAAKNDTTFALCALLLLGEPTHYDKEARRG